MAAIKALLIGIAEESTRFSHPQRLLVNHIETWGGAVRVMEEEYEPSSPICAVSKTCAGLANSGSLNEPAAAYQALVRLVGHLCQVWGLYVLDSALTCYLWQHSTRSRATGTTVCS